MTKNPFLNALAALTYISIISSVMFFTVDKKLGNTILVPIFMLSLFSLSAAIMGYIFLSQPVQLFLDGKKKAGVKLFLQTVGIFACIPVLVLILINTKVLR